jgi:hypothetical protein
MSNLVVIVPSRGRPENAKRLVGAFLSGGATVHFALDDDDPMLSEYEDFLESVGDRRVGWTTAPRKHMVEILNDQAAIFTGSMFTGWAFDCIGFMGDDHLPRTPNWNREIVAALGNPGIGIVYGDDLYQRQNLPTAVFMKAKVIQALGYMAPPGLWHLYADEAWKAWGDRAECIRYLPDLVIEHIHPIVGTAEWDAGYRDVNSRATWRHDKRWWDAYQRDQLDTDVQTLWRLMRRERMGQA